MYKEIKSASISELAVVFRKLPTSLFEHFLIALYTERVACNIMQEYYYTAMPPKNDWTMWYVFESILRNYNRLLMIRNNYILSKSSVNLVRNDTHTGHNFDIERFPTAQVALDKNIEDLIKSIEIILMNRDYILHAMEEHINGTKNDEIELV